MARGAVRVAMVADASGVQRGVRDAEQSISRLERAVTNAFGSMRLRAVVAGAAIGTSISNAFQASLRTGIDELQEAEKVSAQTAAAIRSTGGAAGVTRQHVEKLSGSLQALTGKEDDAIQAAANLGLSFTNVRNRGDGLNAVYDRMVRATVDISSRTGKNLNPVMLALGRALDNPTKGMTALSRIGVRFDEETQKRIKTLQEEGRTLEAQRVILAAVEARYKGAGEAAGGTTAGKVERLKRAWEDSSQTLATALLPVLERVADGLLKNRRIVENVARGFASAIGGMVKFVGQVFKGDWQGALNTATTGARKTFQAIGKLAEVVLLPLARKAGMAIARGLADGLDAGLAQVRGSGALRRFLGLTSRENSFDAIGRRVGLGASSTVGAPPAPSSSTVSLTRAGGGFIPGDPRAGDVQPVLATGGEVFLTDQQQAMLGRSRIMRVLVATGGVIGGNRFAAGGWVNPGPGMRRSGAPGVGTHSFSAEPNNWQSDMGYDLMGTAGMPAVATTDGLISRISPYSSNPRFWGYGVYLDVPGGQFFYKHLKTVTVRAGQRVSAGQQVGTIGVGVNGGPHIHFAATSRELLEKAVGSPMRAGSSSVSPSGDVAADGPSPDDAQAPDYSDADVEAILRRGRPTGQFRVNGRTVSPRNPADRGALTSASRVTASARRQGVANARVLARGVGEPPPSLGDIITGRHRDDTLQDARAGDQGEAAARRGGVTNPDVIAAARDLAITQTRIAELRADRADSVKELNKQQGLRRKRVQDLQRLKAAVIKARKRAVIVALLERMSKARQDIADYWETIQGLQRDIADIDAKIAELGYQEQQAIDILATEPATVAGGDTSGSRITRIGDGTTPVPDAPAELTGEQRRLINQGILGEEFIRTILGPGDIGAGGANAIGAATGGRFVTLRVDAQSLAKATAIVAGDQPYRPAAIVPAGV